MHIVKGSSLAFHALAYMARRPQGQSLGAGELAQAVGASPSYLAKLLQKLSRAALVTSRRGFGGGFSLARPPSEISMAAVILALSDAPDDLPLHPRCASCQLAAICPITAAVRRAEESIEEQFRSLTVASLARLLGGGAGQAERGAAAAALEG